LSEILILNTHPERADECAALQPLCYPTLAADEQVTPAQFIRHVHVFPLGQFMAVDRQTDRVVGTTAGFLTHYDRISPDYFRHHTFYEATGGNWLTNHNPSGNYYYGIDMCVHPDYRGQGIARKLHDARKALARRLGLKGQVLGGMLPGYAKYTHVMSVHDYAHHVQKGVIHDSTFTTQLRNGFEFRGLLQNYLKDPPTNGWSTLLEWPNPGYIETTVNRGTPKPVTQSILPRIAAWPL